MVIRLTAACNNACFFCFVDDEMSMTHFRPTVELLAEIDSANEEEEIDIFGGEPTIDPSFWQVMERALSQDRNVSLASNVRLFSKLEKAKRLADMSNGRLVIRTSLMGHNAELHDTLNVAKHAFTETIDGIKNLTEVGFDVPTNIVVLKENVDFLLHTALTAISAGSRRIKFSGTVRTFKFLDSIPNPELVKEQLEKTIPILLSMGIQVTLEKFPLCIVRKFIHLTQPEFDNFSSTYAWFRRTEGCNSCSLVSACQGAEIGALTLFGTNWIQPIKEVPEECMADLSLEQLNHFEPKANIRFIRVNNVLENLEMLPLLTKRFSNIHPQIQFI